MTPHASALEAFRWTHAWLPLAACLGLSLALMPGGGDLAIADMVYGWEGQRWALKSSFFADGLIHIGGRDLSTMAWLGVFVAWLVARSKPAWAAWRRPLGYLLLATATSALLVAWIKSWSNMDCPWDLARYGGERPYVPLLGVRPLGLSRGVCFPAGHAAAGYSWMALYFFLLAVRPRLRWAGFALGLILGLLFGMVQQLRGAHFASHDVWTATLCWLVPLGLYRLPWTSPLPVQHAGPMHVKAQFE